VRLRLSTVTHLSAALFALIAAGLLGGVLAARHAQQEETSAMHRQAEYKQLGEDLSQAASTLAANSRSFVITGRQQFADAYWRELLTKRTREHVLAQLRRLGAPAEDLRLIRRAKRVSDLDVRAATHAMRLAYDARDVPVAKMAFPVQFYTLPMREQRMRAGHKLALARQLVFGSLYVRNRGHVTAAIARFQALTNRRSTDAAEASQHAADVWMSLLLGLALAFLLLVAAVLGVVHRMVGLPVARYASALRLRPLEEGVELTPAGVDELRLLARVFNEHLETRRQALTDPLTGLGNRRKLMRDVGDVLSASAPRLLALYDLDGFKVYNDTHGHPGGDALLALLSRRVQAAVAPRGEAYRLGGDEFCVLVPADAWGETLLEAASVALTDETGRCHIRPSFGVARLPQEARDIAGALKLADQRMYAHKESRRAGGESHVRDALKRVLDEQQSDLHTHSESVASLAMAVARRLGLDGRERDRIVLAAELHDIGKVALPTEILRKPDPLSDDESRSMRKHTEIGERILTGLPVLAPVARLVRSTHERFDGAGYPDGLAGEQIPLGARIIAVCDAFDAMTSDRSYRHRRDEAGAMAELERCAGTQFDPRVVNALREELAGPLAEAA
jgi:diguanylate cyclase (GGDEF)-like protein